jgi:hypothetical protein
MKDGHGGVTIGSEVSAMSGTFSSRIVAWTALIWTGRCASRRTRIAAGPRCSFENVARGSVIENVERLSAEGVTVNGTPFSGGALIYPEEGASDD